MTSTTPTLTDRYVQAVLGGVPSGDRPELEREIRALIADTIEAKAADGTLDADAAERAALTELGNPGALATRYTGKIDYLLGPGVYPVWRGIITVLLGVLVPTLGILVLTVSLLTGSTPGTAISAGIATAFNAAVQTLFWFTLVFALIERFAGSEERAGLATASVEMGRIAGRVSGSPDRPWTVDDLPDLLAQGRMSVGDMAAAIVANVFLVAGLIWVQTSSPFVIDGQSYPLFDPALWSFWLPWFIVIAALEIVFTVAVYRRGRWTYTYAVGNALLGAAFAIPAIYLLANQLLFNPAFVDALGAESNDWLQVTTIVTSLVIVGAVGWDAIDGFLKARRSASALGDAA
jgi:hypothetical protein